MPDGTKVVKMNIATTDRWKDRQTGETRERTEWHYAEVIINKPREGDYPAWIDEKIARLATGTLVEVEGEMRLNRWTDKDSGEEKSRTEIRVLRFKDVQDFPLEKRGGNQNDNGDGGNGGGAWPPDEEVPF